jgi:LysR family glycine cleavage system transcriptional activator
VRRIPPLTWVRVFETAARHESFVSAARELSLSRGAVSRTIKELEGLMGVALFVRSAHGARLTDVGRDYARAISPAIGEIARASVQARLNARDRLHAST